MSKDEKRTSRRHRAKGLWILAALASVAFSLGLAACTPASKADSQEAQQGAAQQPGSGVVQEVAGMEQFNKEVASRPGKTVIDFYATWCGPCKQYAPTLEKLAAEKMPGVNFVKVDVDKVKDVAQQYQIEALPTTVIMENGKETKRLVGVQSEETIREALGTES